MPQRFPAMLLVLALSAAPAYAQTTPTTGTPATSTTTPGGRCARGNPTLCPIDIRIESFREAVRQANLRRLDAPIVFRLQRSARCLTRATALCDGRLDTDENRAREKLQQCVRRPLVVVLAKIRSNYVRRIIRPDLAATLASEADGLVSEVKAARKSLTCP